MSPVVNLEKYENLLENIDPVCFNGKVIQVIGLVIESIGPAVSIGEICIITSKKHDARIKAEVVGFRNNRVLLMPLGEMYGIEPGSEVVATQKPLTVKVGNSLLGRVLDGLGNPLDRLGAVQTELEYPVYNQPSDPLNRQRIEKPISTSIRSIDSLLTIGQGQRVGIFAGSGVGKSVLLGMIARYSDADVNVIALIGERGREVREFIEKDLGVDGLKKSVLVVATSEKSALERIKGAFLASAIAEYFRDQGKKVMLMMDSVTRFAMAQREVGLATGEPPATKGYTPSVFAWLPKLLERAGTSENSGSITGIYTVLVEADDMNEPISDAVRSILDGHIVLSRELAHENHYPAIDVLQSVSRVMVDIAPKEQLEQANLLRDVLVTYKDAEDLINIGAYAKGSNPRIDYALKNIGEIKKFLKQDLTESSTYEDSIAWLHKIFAGGGMPSTFIS